MLSFNIEILLESAICILGLVFLGVDFDTRWTERKKAFRVFAEVENKFFVMEGAMSGLVLRLRHKKNWLINGIGYKVLNLF